MRKKVTRIIIITIIISVIIAICCLKNDSIFKYEYAAKTRFLNDGNTVNSENRDNIYFFHTGSSDCMLIESNGHYGLVDTSNRYSQTITDSNGTVYSVTQHESLSNQDYFYSGKDVANYIVNALGVDHIDFVIGTHAHSDHIGGVDEICNQKLSNGNYLIDNRTHYFYKTYYHMSKMNNINDDLDENGNIITRTGTWHNQAFVYRAVKSMQDRGAKIINVSNGVKISSNSQTVFPDITNINGNNSHLTNAVYNANDLNNYYDDYISFDFGNYNIRLYNLFTGNSKNDENVNSILTLITKANSSILLTGDINIEDNTEALLAKEIQSQIGEIDLYKIAHHANNESNSKEVYDYLKPKYCVATKGGGDPKPLLCQRHYANKRYGTNFYETQFVDKAVVANIGNDNITFYELYDEDNNSNNRYTYNPMYRQLAPRSIYRSGNWSGWFNWASYDYNNYMFLEESGNSYIIKKGWFYTSEAWRYANDDGLAQYGWNYINNEWYYFARYGEIKLNDNSYYPETAMVEGWQWLKFDNNSYWFYFTPEPNSIKKEGSNEYYPEGSMVQGWQYINYQGKNRYFYLSKGVNDIAGYPRGAMITGKQLVEYNGNKYYFYFCKETGNPTGYVMGEMLSNITYEGDNYNSSGVLIDNTAPEIIVAYSTTNLTNQNVIVTLTANEELQEIEGWTLSADKKTLTKEYEQNTTEQIIIKDLVGNSSTVSIAIINIDKAAPIGQVAYSTTNQNVTVTITANEEIQEVEGWTREENRKVLTKEYSENKTEEITIKDLVGNETKVNVEINNIDKIAPTANVEYNEANPTNQNVTVTITANEEIQEIEGWTREENRKVLTKEYSENKTEEITIKDLVGNETKVNVEITNIDKVAPTVNVEYSTTALTNQNVTVTITANEEVQEIEGWIREENRKVLTKEYSENITEEITIKDLAGNETKVNLEIANIDKKAPVIEGVKDKKSYSRKATPRAVDDNLESVTLEKEGQVIVGYENGTTITELGTYKITAIDKVGNKTEVEFYIKDIPSTKEAVEYIITPEGPTNQDVKVSVTKKEAEEYHDFIVQMSIDGENYEAIMEKTITENGIVYVRIVKEEEGNTIEAEELEIEINNIDKIAPKAQVGYSTTNPTNQNVTVTINTNEEIQEVEGWTISQDKKKLTKEYNENKTEKVIIKDKIGNEKEVDVKVLNIDRTIPVVSVVYSTKNKTNKNVTVTITANEKVQEITGWTLSSDKKKLTKEYSVNKTETITIKDLAGNTSNVAIEITNIDKTAPTVNVEYSTTNLTNQNVTVRITANEDIQGIIGWTLSNDKKTLTKTYQSNVEETIQVKDLAGNTVDKNISIKNIDKTKPEIAGVENTNSYNDSVIITVTDVNPGTLLLEKDGEKVEGYTNGKEIIQEGTYKLTAVDKLGNTTIVNFTIKYVRGDLNKDSKIDMLDVLKILKHLSQEKKNSVSNKHPEWKLNEKGKIISDTDRNGKVEMLDVLKILKYISAKSNRKTALKHPEWLNIN